MNRRVIAPWKAVLKLVVGDETRDKLPNQPGEPCPCVIVQSWSPVSFFCFFNSPLYPRFLWRRTSKIASQFSLINKAVKSQARRVLIS